MNFPYAGSHWRRFAAERCTSEPPAACPASLPAAAATSGTILRTALCPCTPCLYPPQVVTEVFNWTRNPAEARRLAQRREALLGEMLGGRKPLVPPGVEQLMDILQRNQVGFFDLFGGISGA